MPLHPRAVNDRGPGRPWSLRDGHGRIPCPACQQADGTYPRAGSSIGRFSGCRMLSGSGAHWLMLVYSSISSVACGCPHESVESSYGISLTEVQWVEFFERRHIAASIWLSTGRIPGSSHARYAAGFPARVCGLQA